MRDARRLVATRAIGPMDGCSDAGAARTALVRKPYCSGRNGGVLADSAVFFVRWNSESGAPTTTVKTVPMGGARRIYSRSGH
jgi:hypothetical protein